MSADHPNIVPFYGITDWNIVGNEPIPGLVSLHCKHNTVSAYLRNNPRQRTPQVRLAFVGLYLKYHCLRC